MHNWLAATQYIAPLMANFDTRPTDDSVVKMYDDGKTYFYLYPGDRALKIEKTCFPRDEA